MRGSSPRMTRWRARRACEPESPGLIAPAARSQEPPSAFTQRLAQEFGGLRQLLDIDARQRGGERVLGLPQRRDHHLAEQMRFRERQGRVQGLERTNLGYLIAGNPGSRGAAPLARRTKTPTPAGCFIET